MSAYARQASVGFRSPAVNQSSNRRDGIHRFSQRRVSTGRYNDKVNARSAVDNRIKERDDSSAFNCEEAAPIEGSIHASNAEEYPFSQITMSQCSAGESSFFSLRSSGVAASDRMNSVAGSSGRPLSGSREFRKYSSSKQVNTPSRKNDAVGSSRGEKAASTTNTNDDDSFQSSQPLLTPLPPRNLNDALQRTDEKQHQPQQQRFGTNQPTKHPPKSTPRRDKRARIQLPHLVMRPPPQQQQMPPPQVQPSLSTRYPFQTSSNRRAFVNVANSTFTQSMRTPSSFVARSAHAVRSVAASAMTPLRTFRLGQPSVAIPANAVRITPVQQGGYAAPSSGTARDDVEEQQPSPLERSGRRRFEGKQDTASFSEKKQDDESVVERSVPIKHTNGIHQFQLSQSSNCQDAPIDNADDDDDANTKTSASTYDPNKTCVLKTNDEINFRRLTDDVLAQIETAKKEMETTKKEMEDQRQLIDAKHRELLEAQELLARQRHEFSEMIKSREDIAELIERAREDIEAKTKEAKETIERSSIEFNSSSKDQRDRLCQVANDSKKNIEMHIMQILDDSKASFQVSGKLEVEALEKQGRVINTELLALVERATGDLESECQRYIESLQAESRSVETDLRQMIEGIVAATKNDFKLWVTNVVDKENLKPSDCDASFEEPILNSLLSTVTRSENSTKDTPDAEDNSVNEESSLLNNSSISPTPVHRRTPLAQKKYVKEMPSNFSTNSRPGISVSTTFSRKATPRIENSYGKTKRLPLKNADHSSHKMKSSSPPMSSSYSPKDLTPAVDLKESDSTTPAAIHSKNGATPIGRSTKLESPVRAVKKRTLPTTKDRSPRRSKRLRESDRAEKEKKSIAMQF
ncbi:hypothetical protein HJC23_006201 [Cyclotella cryptica]|uniref:Uncharacterized protein n=1 Tax=Cyclotella cryptica TaxID=29204 RepID=A0ABD3PX69_9STRA|eukprot:CCRYP_010835-RA/>CCRYP_010835-RA protein AED:0.11 eAED:0.11 QI:0/-1/0/1/-1/1/1/0/862